MVFSQFIERIAHKSNFSFNLRRISVVKVVKSKVLSEKYIFKITYVINFIFSSKGL